MSRLVMDRAVFRRLYDEGLNDRQIAERCGVSAQTVGNHRRSLGLSANFAQFRWSQETLDHLRMRAGSGWAAAEIAEELGVAQGAVRHAAARHRISIRASRAGVLSPVDEMVIEMMQAGWTQKDIASELGVWPSAVNKRVRKLRKQGRLAESARSTACASSAPNGTPEVAPKVAMAQATPAAPASAAAERLPRVRMSAPRAARPVALVARQGADVVPAIDRRDGVIARLVGRHGADLVQAVAGVGRKGVYRKLASVADTHTVPIRTVESIWHQVRA